MSGVQLLSQITQQLLQSLELSVTNIYHGVLLKQSSTQKMKKDHLSRKLTQIQWFINLSTGSFFNPVPPLEMEATKIN